MQAKSQLTEIHLGMPSKNCQYQGICWMKNITQLCQLNYQLRPNQCLAWIDILSEQNICIRFLLDTISPQTFEQHFKDGVFTVLESIILGQIERGILPKPPRLIAGSYPIITLTDTLEIYCTIDTDYSTPRVLAEMLPLSADVPAVDCLYC